ncbi:cytochrome P450 [Massilia sp. TN1-12]|uniref:cytochrome P450 n=1 Tax=Massilia paldalensis TaxID=3377675 RepID=UPI0038502566
MKRTKQDLLFAAGVLGVFGAGVAAGRMLVRPQPADTTLPRASLLDTLALSLDVVAPTLAKGVIIRRPPVVALAERLELDRRAVRRMQALRARYGPGPLMLRLPIRRQAVVLAPEHVRRVLDETPEPFAAASSEKRAALAHFEPQGVLVSQGAERADRRRFNEGVLEHERAVHHLADSFAAKIDEETAHIMDRARERGELDWDAFASGWYPLVRRVVFGDGARDDQELNDMTVQLRRAANWAFLHPKKRSVQTRFFARIRDYLDRAEAGSLAAVAARMPATGKTQPHQQVPQWLFAFDAAGMATFRALALLASHPQYAERVRAGLRTHGGERRHDLPLLRATVLEALRLWPTTPAILRQTTAATDWERGRMPAGTGILLFAPFFHRDDERLPYADRFTPELWLDEGKVEFEHRDWPLIPFSGGPATCPARNLVLMLTSMMLAALVEDTSFRLAPGRELDPARLPGTLDNYRLRFRFVD